MLDLGFAPVAAGSTAMPRVGGLTASLTGAALLRIRDNRHGPLFTLVLIPGRPYPRAMALGRRVGLLFAADAAVGGACGTAIGGVLRLARYRTNRCTAPVDRASLST
jgi:hypothetical protein